jgi:hypothetical protein
MTSRGSSPRKAWLVRNFWLLTMMLNLALLMVLFVVLILLLS